MKVVVVESPAKAKTINRYLGDGYKVLASYGHVCDLPSKDGSVLPENDFEMKWQISSGSEKHLKDIIAALKGANKLILATDPDREGEAISWHVLEQLKGTKHLNGVDVDEMITWCDQPSAVVRATILELKLAGQLTRHYGNRVSRKFNFLMDLVDPSPGIVSNQPTIRSG